MTPRTVLLEDVWGWTFSTAWPLSATWRLGTWAAWAVPITAFTAVQGRSWAWALKLTIAKAILPSWLIWLAPNGP